MATRMRASGKATGAGEAASEDLKKRRRLLEEGDALYQGGRAGDAAKLLGECLSLFAQDERSTQPYGEYCQLFASALAESGQLRLAKLFFNSALEAYRARGLERAVALTHFNLGNVARYANSRQACFDHYSRSLEVARRLGEHDVVARALLALASFFFGLGVPAKARTYLERFEAMGESARSNPELRWSYLFQRAKMDEAEGAIERAVARFEEALVVAQQMKNASYVSETEGSLGLLATRSPAPLRRIDLLERAYEFSKSQSSPDHDENCFPLAEALAEAGEIGLADERYRECLGEIAKRRTQLDHAQRYHVMEQAAPMVQRYVQRLLAWDRKADAFTVSEQAQARAILDLMFRHQIKRQGGRTIFSAPAGRLMLASPALEETLEDLAHHDTHLLKFFFAQGQLCAWFLTPEGLFEGWDATAAGELLEETVGLLLEINRGLENLQDVDAAALEESWAALRENLPRLYSALLPEKVRQHLATHRGRPCWRSLLPCR